MCAQSCANGTPDARPLNVPPAPIVMCSFGVSLASYLPSRFATSRMQRNTRRCSRLMREKDARRAALAKRDATAAVIGAGDFIGSAIAKTSRDAGSTKSAKATGFLDR